MINITLDTKKLLTQKDDEKYFWNRIKTETRIEDSNSVGNLLQYERKTPRDLINEPDFPIHHKRAWYLLQKWSDKGWYDYGVALDLGWVTEEGMLIEA
jgi:hypothetical protein